MEEHYEMAHPKEQVNYEIIEVSESINAKTEELAISDDVEAMKQRLEKAAEENALKAKYPNPDKKVPYPFDPYYYHPTGKQWSCEQCPFKTESSLAMLGHMNVHPEDKEQWLRFFIRQRAIDKFRLHSKTEALDEEQLEKWIESDYKEICMQYELKSPEKEQLSNWFEVRYDSLEKWLTGKQRYCPDCGLDIDVCMVPSLQDQFQYDRVLTSLKKNNEAMKAVKCITDLSGFESPAILYNDQVKLDFCTNLHTALSHRHTYRDLVSNGYLRGTLPSFLITAMSEQSTETLNSGNLFGGEAGLKKLTNSMADYRNWFLKKQRKS
jgi:hypothetical protein